MAARHAIKSAVDAVVAKKTKIQLNNDDETVSCRICSKCFVADLALLNHVRMEHFSTYSNGDPTEWTCKIEKPKKDTTEPKAKKTKTEISDLVLGPTDLMNLVSDDVSYIIIKEEPGEGNILGKTKKKKEGTEETAPIVPRREKVVKPATGPYECLQPSTLVADGTCHQIFFSCCEYSLHFRDEHTRRRNAIQCQVCEKPLTQGTGLPEENPFTCEYCDAVFQTKKQLKDHTNKLHVRLKPYQCSTCFKRFIQPAGLQQHMRMHSGDRPFPCTICPKAFTQKSGLDQHLRIHTKVKPYHCVVCQKSFIQSVHLTQHMRTHTNVSPFECDKCNKKFKQKSHLNYHLQSSHGIRDRDKSKMQKKKYVCMLQTPSDVAEAVEIEIDPSAADLVEQVEAERSITIANEEVSTEETHNVVVEAAEKVQIEQVDDECYVIEDSATETWQIELVDG